MTEIIRFIVLLSICFISLSQSAQSESAAEILKRVRKDISQECHENKIFRSSGKDLLLIHNDELKTGRTSRLNYSLLHCAAFRGDTDDIQYLVNFINIDTLSKTDETALSVAIIHNRISAVKALLQFGPQLNVLTDNPVAPVLSHLKLAIESSSLELVEALVEAGAVSNMPLNGFTSIWGNAWIGEHRKLIKLLNRAYIQPSSLESEAESVARNFLVLKSKGQDTGYLETPDYTEFGIPKYSEIGLEYAILLDDKNTKVMFQNPTAKLFGNVFVSYLARTGGLVEWNSITLRVARTAYGWKIAGSGWATRYATRFGE